MGWETSLDGWSGRGSTGVTTRAGCLDEGHRRGLVGAARRFTRRAAHLVVLVDGGPARTARPVGTRMGKGKGKVAGSRRWTPAGTPLFGVDTPAGAAGLAVLPGRTGLGLKTVRRFY